MTKLELAQYGTPNGKITPLQVYDAVKSCGNNQHYTIPENGKLYEDSDRHLSKIATYPDWGLVVMETAPWSSWSQLQTGTAFIQNNDAAKFIDEVRSANKLHDQPFRRLLRHVWMPTTGTSASAAAWYGDVILHGTLAPELFAATTALSRLTTIVKGIANHAVDRSRGNAMQRMLNMGWSERTMFYPNPKTQSTERPPVEFLHSDIIHIEPRTISENKELWEVLLSSELVSQEGPIYLRAASFFEDILDSFSEDMPELWWERLADDLVFFRAHFDDISSFEKAGDVLTSTEKLTGVSDPTKREEIKQNIADAKASMVARSLEILSVIRQKVQAQEAHNRALQLEQANQERVAIYDKVGLWADIESYPEEHRRDIQTLLNGAIALKDDFIDRYGVEKGLEAVASLDAYTREATELLSRGASFAHIYQGMLNKFGEHETESGADGGNEMVVALPDLEDFQRLYAPEVPQVPLSVFGDRYPGAFYDIAVSGSAQPAECYNSDDLR